MIYWNYFLAIEQDLARLSRYVELSNSNYGTNSVELAKLLMTSTQEVDVCMKKLCAQISPGSANANINDYHAVICRALPELIAEVISIPRYGLTFTPWSNWSASHPPDWWTANNKIKHQRIDEYEKANLGNVLQSMGGLLLTIVHYHKKFLELNGTAISWRDAMQSLQPESVLYRLDDSRYYDRLLI